MLPCTIKEPDLALVAGRFGIAVVPYFSLASGFLSGKYGTWEQAKNANRGYQLGRYFDARGERILAALVEVSAQTGASQASIALAWLLAQPTVTAPITSVAQLDDLTAAVELELPPETVAKLTQASAY